MAAKCQDSACSISREQLLQIGKGQYVRHPPFGTNVTVRDVKKWICKIEGNDGLYDQIMFENDYWMSKLSCDYDNYRIEKLCGNSCGIRVIYVKMEGSGKWYIDYKWERFCKLCIGYCRQIEQEYVMNMPWYLKQVVRNYCNDFNDNQNYLFRH